MFLLPLLTSNHVLRKGNRGCHNCTRAQNEVRGIETRINKMPAAPQRAHRAWNANRMIDSFTNQRLFKRQTFFDSMAASLSPYLSQAEGSGSRQASSCCLSF
jgi:hypothetical protein